MGLRGWAGRSELSPFGSLSSGEEEEGKEEEEKKEKTMSPRAASDEGVKQEEEEVELALAEMKAKELAELKRYKDITGGELGGRQASRALGGAQPRGQNCGSACPAVDSAGGARSGSSGPSAPLGGGGGCSSCPRVGDPLQQDDGAAGGVVAPTGL